MKEGIMRIKGIVQSQNALYENILRTIQSVNNADIISFYKNNKDKKLFLNNINFIDLDTNSWSKLRKKLRNDLKNYNRIYVIFGNIYKIDYRKMLDMTYYDDKYGINFVTNYIILQTLIVIEVALSLGIEIVYLKIDPQEFDLKKIFENKQDLIKEFYILDRNNNYLPFYEYSLITRNENKLCHLKLRDFAFRATCLTNDRKYLEDNKEIIEKLGGKIITKTKSETISQNDYYDELSFSNFTLIVPSYDITTFSIIRFFEALSLNCLPLLYYTVNLNDLRKTFPEIYNIYIKYKEKLIVNNFNDLENIINNCINKSEDIINEFKSTNDYQNFLTIDYTKNLFKEKIYESKEV